MSGLTGLSSASIASLFAPLRIAGQTTGSSVIQSILGAANGSPVSTSSGPGGLNPITALKIAQANQKKDVTNEAKAPQVSRDITTFTAAVKKATSAKQFLQNPVVLKVLLTANGLGSEAKYPALAQQALMSNPADPNSLANKLAHTNSQWLSVAQTYDFATKGLSIVQDPKVLSTITNGYAEVKWRQSLDKQTPGLSNALYALKNAKNFTSAVQILGDPVMRNVVTTALGIPQQIAFQDLGAQERAINNRLNVGDFQKPNFVQSFIDRYLVTKQASAQTSASSGSTNLVRIAASAQDLIA